MRRYNRVWLWTDGSICKGYIDSVIRADGSLEIRVAYNEGEVHFISSTDVPPYIGELNNKQTARAALRKVVPSAGI